MTKKEKQKEKNYFFLMEVDTETVSQILKKHGYTIQKQIGRGAQGACFVVLSEKYSTEFVCKCMQLSAKMKDFQKNQFDREIYSLSHVIHPNIVKIYEHFSEFRYMFMIIEYCPEGSLMAVLKKNEEFIKKHRKFHFAQIRKYLIDILSALTYCHEEMKMSHHDIKPENIVVDQYGRAKLCDFGLAHILQSQFTDLFQKPNLGGTLLYMSPELIKTALKMQQNYNVFAADVWAFGVTAFTVIAFKFPFYGQTLKDVLKSQTEQLIPNTFFPQEPIFNLLPADCPSDVRTVIIKSLEFDEKRRATAKELLEEFKKTPAALYGGASTPQFSLRENTMSINNLTLHNKIKMRPKNPIAGKSNTLLTRKGSVIIRPIVSIDK